MEFISRLAVITKAARLKESSSSRPLIQWLLNKLKTTNLWFLLWISVVLSEVFTAVMNTILGLLWWGRINRDLLLIGSVDGFVVALLVTFVLILLIREIRKQESHAEKMVFENELVYRKQVESSLKEKEMLLRELYHRTKNNMQVISSLIGLHTAAITDERILGLLKDIQNRIKAMSLIHEQLYKSGDLASVDIKEYMKVLANFLLLSYQEQAGKVALSLDIERVPLSIDNIMPCGLILNELISNSLKYAFPGDRTGVISISLHQVKGDQVEFIFADDGVGLPSADVKKTETLGLRLVNNLATKQLGGKLEVKTGKGTEFHITFKRG